MASIDKGRALCDEYGFRDCELIINEWHFMTPGGFAALRSPDAEVRRKVWSGPGSHNGIDSSCFNLTLLSKFQTSKLDQAYYYGCSHIGPWGYKDGGYAKYKVYYGLKMFGDFVKSFGVICASSGSERVTVLAARSKDAVRKGVIVSDYLSGEKDIEIEFKGVGGDAEAKVYFHDNKRNCEVKTVKLTDGKLVLSKQDTGSAAFLILF
jgi:hypothetical protein